MLKKGLIVGIAAGVACGLSQLIPFLLGYSPRNNPLANLMLLLCVFFGPFAAIYTVKKINGGEITFFQALKVGVVSALVSTTVFILFTAVYYYVLNPNFAVQYLKDIEISLKSSGVTGKEFKEQMESWKEDFSPENQLITKYVSMSIFASFFGLINAVILCKKD